MINYGWVNTRSIIANNGNLVTAQRCPINVNLAGLEVLTAALIGIRADDGTTIDKTTAENLAKYLQQYRPYPSWEKLRRRLAACPSLSAEQAEMVFIATTTNAHSREHDTPDYYSNYISPEGKYDKSKIVAVPSEFCLGTVACFRIEAKGQLTENKKPQVATHLLAVAKLGEVCHVTSENQFDQSMLSNSYGVVTAPFMDDSSHPTIGYVKMDFFGKDYYQQPKRPPADGKPVTAGGGGEEIFFTDTSKDFTVTLLVNDQGQLNDSFDLRWKTTVASGDVGHHLSYNPQANIMRCTSMLIPGPEIPEVKTSPLIFYQSNINANWQQQLPQALTTLYWDCLKYFYPGNKVVEWSGETIILNATIIETFPVQFCSQHNCRTVYQGFAYADMAHMSQPLLGKVKVEYYNSSGNDGQTTAEKHTKIVEFNAVDFLVAKAQEVEGFGPAPYMYPPFLQAMFNGNISVRVAERSNTHFVTDKAYTEGVTPDYPVLHPYDRTRWEQILQGPFPKNSLLTLLISPDSNIKANFVVRIIDFDSEKKGGGDEPEYTLLTPKIIGENTADDEAKMGSTLNCWYGLSFPIGLKGREVIYSPSDRTESVYYGKLKISEHLSPFRIGTFRWTGYAPIMGTSVRFYYKDGQEYREISQDGEWEDADTKPLPSDLKTGDELRFKIVFQNQSAHQTMTPFFEDFSFLAITTPHLYMCQEITE